MNQTDEQREQIILEPAGQCLLYGTTTLVCGEKMSDLKNGDSLCECSLTK